jgi:hypothetical protein
VLAFFCSIGTLEANASPQEFCTIQDNFFSSVRSLAQTARSNSNPLLKDEYRATFKTLEQERRAEMYRYLERNSFRVSGLVGRVAVFNSGVLTIALEDCTSAVSWQDTQEFGLLYILVLSGLTHGDGPVIVQPANAGPYGLAWPLQRLEPFFPVLRTLNVGDAVRVDIGAVKIGTTLLASRCLAVSPGRVCLGVVLADITKL